MGDRAVLGTRNPGEVLPIMAYTGRLRPKGVNFKASGILKSRDVTS